MRHPGAGFSHARGLSYELYRLVQAHYIQMAARGEGYPGSFWKTDVDVQNAGVFAAYGSVLDNRTSDPVTVLPQ